MQRYRKTQARKIPKAVKFKDGRQLEAEVHTSLPPLVRGVLIGHVRVCLTKILWEYSIGPPAPKLCVKLKWWGEQSKGTLFRVPVEGAPSKKPAQNDCTTLAYFPVRSGVPQLKAYLSDMGPLQLQIGLGHMIEDSMVIGQSTIPELSVLAASNPVEGFYPIVNSDGIHLGRLQICFNLELAESRPASKRPASRDKRAPVVVPPSPPEFVVGPGAKSYDSPHVWKGRGVDTVLSAGSVMEQDRIGNSQERFMTISEEARVESAVHVPTSETKVHVPASAVGDPAGDSRSQQIEVISSLIERGQKLRDAMVQSVLLEPSVMMADSQPSEDQDDVRYPFLSGKFISVEFPQKDKFRRKQQKATRKSEKLPESVPFSDQKIVDLVLGDSEKPESDLNGGCLELSSEEEEEGVGLEEELSMNESDYPLHDASLLQKLLYSEPGEPESTKELHSTALTSTEPPHSAPSEEQKHPLSKQTSQLAATSKLSTHPLANPEMQESSSTAKQHHSKSPTTSTSSETEISPPSQNQESEVEGSSDRIDSWSSLSLFGRQDKALEATILQAVGMEKLTRLGRVTSARVAVERLQLDANAAKEMQRRKRVSKTPQHAVVPSSSPTYFIEYRFPAAVHPSKATARAPFLSSHEVMRVASKKLSNGTVKFSHRSVFPVAFSSSVILQWWNSTLTFRIYCRPPNERMPFLVGKAVIPLRKWLGAHSLSTQCQLDVRACSLADASGSRGVSSEDAIAGNLQVSLQLVAGKKQHWVPPEPANPSQRSPSAALTVLGEKGELSGGLEGRNQQPTAVTLRESNLNPKDITQKPPAALQLLLLISEGVDITIQHVPAATPDTQPPKDPTKPALSDGGIPNCYLVCKLFCCDPHPQTPVQWASTNPQFTFRQVYPLYLTPSLLEKVCNNFTVIEVWHRTPGTTTDNELIGLVKLSLHQFYLAFSEEASASLCQKAELPVVAVDCYCPVVNPFSGTQQGYLAVMLALGTASQVSLLQQRFAAGSYILQHPHRKKSSTAPALDRAQRTHQAEPRLVEDDRETFQDAYTAGHTHHHHVFSLTVEGVRGLSVFSNTVWGEADCFVQYHFPALSEEDPDEGQRDAPEVHLQPYRTGTVLCIPDPSFRQERLHPLPLPSGYPLQKVLMGACGSGRGGVPFELWRRFYYPNIRDQLVAKASLPLAKLCAMVSMQRTTEPNVQCFSLPLRLITAEDQDESGGLLDITVKYQASSQSPTESPDTERGLERTHINLSLGILRASGLKDAAVLAARDHPVPLGFAAEVGVNTYARVSIDSLLDRKHTTKTIARSFAPAFSHFFDFALPLSMKEGAHRTGSPQTEATTSRLRRVTLAEKLVESCALVELWHKVPRRDLWAQPAGGRGGAFGRRLGPIFKDILLGYVELPLLQLLSQHTGIHGWFALLAPESDYSAALPSDPDPHSPLRHVGGVELSLSFTSEDDRKLVMARGIEMGWTPPRGRSMDLMSPLPSQVGDRGEVSLNSGRKQWKFEIKMSGVWVPLEAVTLPTVTQPAYKYCYVRYKFFETTPVVTAPKAVTYSRDGVACYQLKHRARLFTVDCSQMKWYLREETLEVQVWATALAGKPKESRPKAEDTLLGFAYVPLGEILSDKNEVYVSGCYPLFKAGVDSLGGQMLRVELRRTLAEGSRDEEKEIDSDSIEVLDSSVEEDSCEHCSPAATQKEHETEAPPPKEDTHGVHPNTEILKEMFQARIVIQQALHLPMISSCQRQDECTPSAYVAVHPHPNVEKIVTLVVPNSHKPIWEHQCMTHIPNLYLDPQCQGLEFQVWSKLQGRDCPPSQGPRQDDSYIGCVHVDLSPLGYGLGHTCGWYNIVDFGGQIQGQLKVNVIPTKRISFSSKLLSTPLHVSMSATGSILSRSGGGEQPSVLVSRVERYDKETDSEAKSTSALFRQLRENIQELDKVHQTLESKLQRGADPMIDDSLPTDTQKAPSLETPHLSTTTTAVTTLVEPMTGWATKETTEPYHVSLLHEVALSERKQTEPSTSRTDNVGLLPVASPFESSSSVPDAQTPVNMETGHPLLPVDRLTPTVPSQEGSESSLSASLLSGPSPGESFTLTDVSACSHDEPLIHSHDSLPTEAQTTQHTLDSHASVIEESPPAVHVQDTVERAEDGPDRSADGSQQSSVESDSHGSDLSGSESEGCSRARSPGAKTASPLKDQDICASAETSGTGPPLSGRSNSAQSSLPATVGAPREHQTTGGSHLYAPQSGHLPVGQNGKMSEERSNSSASPPSTTTKPSHRHRHRPTATSEPLPPEIQLPNFFMPPHQLEETMRSLRATALSRPPARRLFEPSRRDPDHAREGSDEKQHHAASHPGLLAFRSVDEVSKYLNSRRSSSSDRVSYRHLSTTENERIARIFVSNPY